MNIKPGVNLRELIRISITNDLSKSDGGIFHPSFNDTYFENDSGILSSYGLKLWEDGDAYMITVNMNDHVFNIAITQER